MFVTLPTWKFFTSAVQYNISFNCWTFQSVTQPPLLSEEERQRSDVRGTEPIYRQPNLTGSMLLILAI